MKSVRGKGELEALQFLKKVGAQLPESYLDAGFILDKKVGLNQPKRVEKAKILIANTAMDTDKIKVFGSRVRVDSVSKVSLIHNPHNSLTNSFSCPFIFSMPSSFYISIQFLSEIQNISIIIKIFRNIEIYSEMWPHFTVLGRELFSYAAVLIVNYFVILFKQCAGGRIGVGREGEDAR